MRDRFSRNRVNATMGARVEFSEEDGCLVGHLVDMRDIVGFDATTVKQLQSRFRQAVDDYLWATQQLCARHQKRYRGRMKMICSRVLDFCTWQSAVDDHEGSCAKERFVDSQALVAQRRAA